MQESVLLYFSRRQAWGMDWRQTDKKRGPLRTIALFLSLGTQEKSPYLDIRSAFYAVLVGHPLALLSKSKKSKLNFSGAKKLCYHQCHIQAVKEVQNLWFFSVNLLTRGINLIKCQRESPSFRRGTGQWEGELCMVDLACNCGQGSKILVGSVSPSYWPVPLLKEGLSLLHLIRFIPLVKRFTEKNKDFVPLSQPVYGTGYHNPETTTTPDVVFIFPFFFQSLETILRRRDISTLDNALPPFFARVQSVPLCFHILKVFSYFCQHIIPLALTLFSADCLLFLENALRDSIPCRQLLDLQSLDRKTTARLGMFSGDRVGREGNQRAEHEQYIVKGRHKGIIMVMLKRAVKIIVLERQDLLLLSCRRILLFCDSNLERAPEWIRVLADVGLEVVGKRRRLVRDLGWEKPLSGKRNILVELLDSGDGDILDPVTDRLGKV